MLNEAPLERLALRCAHDGDVQRTLREAQRPHAVMNAPRAQTALRDLETTSLAKQQIACGHADICELHFRMACEQEASAPVLSWSTTSCEPTVRRVVVAKHRERSDDSNTRGVQGHKNHRLLLVHLGRRVGLAHCDGEARAGVSGAACRNAARVACTH